MFGPLPNLVQLLHKICRRSTVVKVGYIKSTSRKPFYSVFQECEPIFLHNFDFSQIKSRLVLSRGPMHLKDIKIGLNQYSGTTSSSQFSKRPFYGQNLYWYSLLIIPLILLGLSDMGSLLIIVVNLYIHKDIDVRNLRKFEYFYEDFRHTHNA